MRALFAIAFVLLIVCSAVMWDARRPVTTGRLALTWTSDDNPQRKDQRGLFAKLNPDIDLHLDPTNEGMEKVIVQSMGGVGPDLFDCRSATQLSAYVRAGIALDVTDLLAAKGIDITRDAWPAMQPMAIWDGRTYGVPTNIAPNAMWFHRDVLREAGIAEPKGPWHWDALIRLAQRLTRRDAKGRPIQFGFMFDWYNWPHFLKGYGARVFNETGTRCALDSDEAERAVQLMVDLVYKYRVSPNPTEESSMASKGGWGSGTINLFGAKKGAMALGGRWWLVNLSQFEGLDLGVVESPFGTRREFGAVGRATLVNRYSPRREQALRFLLYECGPEYARLVDRQADGSPAFKRFTPLPQKDEADHEVWYEAAKRATPDWTSPYVSGNVVDRIVNEQLDLVKIGVKPVRKALHDAATKIDAEIQASLKDDPELRAKWQKAESR